MLCYDGIRITPRGKRKEYMLSFLCLPALRLVDRDGYVGFVCQVGTVWAEVIQKRTMSPCDGADTQFLLI